MERFITIKNIQDCLKLKGIIWDGKKGRTQYGLGEDACIEDFDNGKLVPVMLEFKESLYEYNMLLKVTDTDFLIYQELYHPHDDDYMVLYESLSGQWQDLLLKTYPEKYSKVLINGIDETIKNFEESFEEDLLVLKQQMKDLQEKYTQNIQELRNEKKKIQEFVEQSKELEE